MKNTRELEWSLKHIMFPAHTHCFTLSIETTLSAETIPSYGSCRNHREPSCFGVTTFVKFIYFLYTRWKCQKINAVCCKLAYMQLSWLSERRCRWKADMSEEITEGSTISAPVWHRGLRIYNLVNYDRILIITVTSDVFIVFKIHTESSTQGKKKHAHTFWFTQTPARMHAHTHIHTNTRQHTVWERSRLLRE